MKKIYVTSMCMALVEVASVRTATLAEDALRFVATKDVMPGDARALGCLEIS